MPEKIMPGSALLGRPGENSGHFRPTATMPSSAPASHRRHWERLGLKAGRSYLAAVQLHCLDCVCWYRAEARDCAISTCALWALNRRIFARRTGQAEAEREEAAT